MNGTCRRSDHPRRRPGTRYLHSEGHQRYGRDGRRPGGSWDCGRGPARRRRPAIDPLGTLPGFSWSGRRRDQLRTGRGWPAHADVRRPGQAFRLSTHGEHDGPGGACRDRNSFAWDVNSAGHVVGTSDTGEGRYSMAAVLWGDGQVFDLNDLATPGTRFTLTSARRSTTPGTSWD